MKITLFIDCLGSGGAQRQIVMLAKLLKEKDYNVSMLCYHSSNAFFKPLLEESDINVHFCKRSKVGRLFEIRDYLNRKRPDLVIAYLESPSMIAEICRLTGLKFQLIVSDRSLDKYPNSINNQFKYLFYRVADAVVANSYSQGELLNTFPKLKGKIKVIPNCVDLSYFYPDKSKCITNQTVISVIGSVWQAKNPINLIESLNILLRTEPKVDVKVKWYGKNSCSVKQKKLFNLLIQKIQEYSLNHVIEFIGPTLNVRDVYWNSDAICLPSVREGCPNVICEAMACGLPILASNISDNPRYVKKNMNGFLFDPSNPCDIADSIQKFCLLSAPIKEKMGINSRRLSEELLHPKRLFNDYMTIINELYNEY